jgi:predicted DCC family thiol-disulfide oxidoreductase YuxK
MTDELPLVLYDGHCGLCQRSVRFLLRHERGAELKFAALTSDTGRRLRKERGVSDDIDSIIFLDAERTLTRSDAALALCAYLRHPWRALRVFRVLPRPLRDALYRGIARRRYRWFGQTETCPLPAPGQAERFLG